MTNSNLDFWVSPIVHTWGHCPSLITPTMLCQQYQISHHLPPRGRLPQCNCPQPFTPSHASFRWIKGFQHSLLQYHGMSLFNDKSIETIVTAVITEPPEHLTHFIYEWCIMRVIELWLDTDPDSWPVIPELDDWWDVWMRDPVTSHELPSIAHDFLQMCPFIFMKSWIIL